MGKTIQSQTSSGNLPTRPESEGLYEVVKDGEKTLWFVSNSNGWWAYSLESGLWNYVDRISSDRTWRKLTQDDIMVKVVQ